MNEHEPRRNECWARMNEHEPAQERVLGAYERARVAAERA